MTTIKESKKSIKIISLDATLAQRLATLHLRVSLPQTAFPYLPARRLTLDHDHHPLLPAVPLLARLNIYFFSETHCTKNCSEAYEITLREKAYFLRVCGEDERRERKTKQKTTSFRMVLSSPKRVHFFHSRRITDYR